MNDPCLSGIMKSLKMPPPEMLAHLAHTEKWFSDVHDQLYNQHQKLARAKDGFMCKILECGMGAHDHAWCQFESLLQALGIPNDMVHEWRKEKEAIE